MTVAIILDPAEVAVNRTELVLTPYVGAAVDWGDAAIEAYMAEAALGSVPIDFRVPNRVIQIPLVLRQVGAVPFSTIRTKVQAKAAIMQREGGWVKRTTALGTVFADVTKATLHFGGSGYLEDLRGADPEATLELECVPDWYGAELDLGTVTETTLPELRRVLTGVKGNYPGRARIIVRDLQGAPQRAVLYGIRSANYSAVATAACAYAADILQARGGANIATIAGSSSTNVIQQSFVGSTAWAPLLATTMVAGTDLTHIGSYRVWVRAYANDQNVRYQLVWNVGSLGGTPEENPPAIIPGTGQFYDLDLGEIRLDRSLVGTHRWQGQFQVKTTGSTLATAAIDRVWLVPLDDAYGVVRMSQSTLPTALSVSDDFQTDRHSTIFTLGGRIPQIGPAWTTTGSTGDFTALFDSRGAGIAYTRPSLGRRWAFTGTASVNQTASSLLDYPVPQVGSEFGIHIRYIDANNSLRLVMSMPTSTSTASPRLVKRIAGTDTTLLTVPVAIGAFGSQATFTLAADSTGVITVTIAVTNPAQTYTTNYTDAALATGGALASGKVGIVHNAAIAAATGADGYWENFTSRPAPPQPIVLQASQALHLRHDGHYSQTADGVGFDRVTRTLGDLPRLPPAGLEGRTVEVFVKGSRGDLASVADSGIDDLSVQVFVRPSWLYVPE